jgi:hypothetical protein
MLLKASWTTCESVEHHRVDNAALNDQTPTAVYSQLSTLKYKTTRGNIICTIVSSNPAHQSCNCCTFWQLPLQRFNNKNQVWINRFLFLFWRALPTKQCRLLYYEIRADTNVKKFPLIDPQIPTKTLLLQETVRYQFLRTSFTLPPTCQALILRNYLETRKIELTEWRRLFLKSKKYRKTADWLSLILYTKKELLSSTL